MEKLLVSITKLHDKYKDNPKTIQKLQYYIDKQLPPLIDQYNKHLNNPGNYQTNLDPVYRPEKPFH